MGPHAVPPRAQEVVLPHEGGRGDARRARHRPRGQGRAPARAAGRVSSPRPTTTATPTCSCGWRRIDGGQLGELIEDAWRLVAPKRLLRGLRRTRPRAHPPARAGNPLPPGGAPPPPPRLTLRRNGRPDRSARRARRRRPRPAPRRQRLSPTTAPWPPRWPSAARRRGSSTGRDLARVDVTGARPRGSTTPSRACSARPPPSAGRAPHAPPTCGAAAPGHRPRRLSSARPARWRAGAPCCAVPSSPAITSPYGATGGAAAFASLVGPRVGAGDGGRRAARRDAGRRRGRAGGPGSCAGRARGRGRVPARLRRRPRGRRPRRDLPAPGARRPLSRVGNDALVRLRISRPL